MQSNQNNPGQGPRRDFDQPYPSIYPSMYPPMSHPNPFVPPSQPQPALYYNQQFPRIIQGPVQAPRQVHVPLPQNSQPPVAAQNVGAELALKSARRWGTVVFIVSVFITILGSFYMLSSLMMYISLKTYNGLKEVLKPLPIDLKINDTFLGAALLISCLIGVGLILQGVTGIKVCGNHTAVNAKRHVSRAKKCLVFFLILYITKFFVEIALVSDVAESLESQIDSAALLVEEYNQVKNDPHLVLYYENGTALFAPEGSTCLPSQRTVRPSAKKILPAPMPQVPPIPEVRPEPPTHTIPPEIDSSKPIIGPSEANEVEIQPPVEPSDLPAIEELLDGDQGIPVNASNERSLWKHHDEENRRLRKDKRRHNKRSKRHWTREPLHFGEPVYFCPQENTLVIQVDMIRGHVKEMLVGAYIMATVFNIVALAVICSCIMCCNKKYKAAFDQIQQVPDQPHPVNNLGSGRRADSAISESQVEMVAYNSSP